MPNIDNDDVIVFDGNDAKYLEWIHDHMNGFVLTSNRSLTPRHTVIHRAHCEKIRILQGAALPGGFTTREYIKVCSMNINALQRWLLIKRSDAKFRECTFCAK